ncbi:glycoside hydrolase family 130 protein [Fodinibius sediminis]|uniref:Predicted glycosyl hydrolase, GH43/DUF377 family n=1 Tax=Fodinibius sediminis TaxID=1214077 RepID=A0A521BDJ2_9BACT|nr:glycoside hydrolase family 130 protein [Fodinibius sediminis]SMO45147.1 Predicted glycosyl hydrolase, GH43/DUF377 family [Fodinibius sediminis]
MHRSKNEQHSETISTALNVDRKSQTIERDSTRVICRFLMHGGDPARAKSIINRIFKLDQSEVKPLLDHVLEEFSDRHLNLRQILDNHYRLVRNYIPVEDVTCLSREQELLIGAYFSMEYAIESAALFNPSIVPHPDQTGVEKGSLRFIMSLRAVGEGHISSMVFRSGIISREGELTFDPPSSYVDTPEVLNPVYYRHLFYVKLREMGTCNSVAEYILEKLPKEFSREDLKNEIKALSDEPKFPEKEQLKCFKDMQRLADSNYELNFHEDHDLSERVIFPVSEEESGGIEDARFVQFRKDNGELVYYGTYTAYDGKTIMPQLIETYDFNHFKINTLNGNAIKNKNLALFPRKINDQYVMLSRQDGENNHIMFSDSIYFWQHSEIIQEPMEPWELIQIGNCGSPIETEYGWLVLTHGVGPIRTYSIGAILLDLEDPTKVIGRLEDPLLRAMEEERIGYVPNVVYTCGALRHYDRLIIPYSMSDVQPAIASVKIKELVDAMKKS